MGFNTGYKNSAGADIGVNLIERSYLMDRYPELADTFKQAGVWAWGFNSQGQIGDNTTTPKSSPVQTISGGNNWKQISSSGGHTAAIKTDGTLWLWGSNGYGQLGVNVIGDRWSPVQTISAGTNWKQVSCGTQVSAAIKTDGTLWTWGRNSYGQLGDNTITNRSSPVQTISAGTNWKQVSCSLHMCAIKTDGTLWSWGYNYWGQLGDNTTVAKSSPIQTISGGTNWKQVSATVSLSSAIKTDGTLWLWGYGGQGQLGDNTAVPKSSPVQTISGGTNWKQVSGTAAIKTDGTLWLWGNNYDGQLGTNNRTSRSSPVQTISAGTNWKQVYWAGSQTSAIKTDGTLWNWGQNSFGYLGDNTTARKSSPVQTVAGGTNWKETAAVAAIRDNSSDQI